jgi:hypothetical protein
MSVQSAIQHGLPQRENDALNVVLTGRSLVQDENKIDYPIALVLWADAHCGDAGWQDLEEFEDDGEIIISTVGFLVPADDPGGKKDHVTLWQTITDGEGIHPFFIPAAMVRQIKIVNT